ncbi:alpha-1,2-fucosyltransferase [Parabacteroides sp. GYB001]|uniref:alpha-1,2-fucosyltransferase n=1 Tax=Parabacteroides leei TaxID=2939491 RepID=UPI002017DD51|nr:alpha-1,2-fucosyltransferase [Parabacteroides leei]MCL3853724.1 alpha-1,2-fucosyltransferase [Parabacteroides leei]
MKYSRLYQDAEVVPVYDTERHYLIAIVYLVIGKYDIFWEEFYCSCEQYLFPDAEKHYFVFTDSEWLLNMELTNVSMFFRKDDGWAMNTCAKYDCMLSIRRQLAAFDYFFYINANYEILSPVWCGEILPEEVNDYFSVLSFDFFSDKHPDSYTYDRNPLCQAYIPYGRGKSYYQASFYGGRVSEMLDLATFCVECIRIDLSNGIMAVWHDESYLNKYLLERNPRVIGTMFCKPEEFEGACRAILRDKNKIFGKGNVDLLKQVFINPFMSYLRDKEMQIRPLHLVERFGRLGNQMFQYAFLLGMKSSCPESNFCLFTPGTLPDESFRSNNLEQVFNIPSTHLADDELVQYVSRTPASCIRLVKEHADSLWQPIETDWPLLSLYRGYWQTELYFKKIAPVIRNVFRFDTACLNKKSRDVAVKIRSCMAVSIHVRRSDYQTATNQEIYGNICTYDYYRRAIALLKTRLQGETCYFFLFSDDPVWVKENMLIENAVVVDWNQGMDSWQDMYLMSLCHHNIIANSTFSWWGAWLNARIDKIVIAPYRWYTNMLAPDILPKGWIALHPSGYQKHGVDFYENKTEDLAKNQLATIYRYKSKNQEIPDEFVLGNPDMGRVICLYTYARYTGNSWFAGQADELLDAIIDTTTAVANEGYTVCYLGCGLIYLLRNSFVAGNEDEILSDIDWRLTTFAMNRPKDFDLLCGWIHYLTFRVDVDYERQGTWQRINDLNKQNLICLLDYLKNHSFYTGLLLDDIKKIDAWKLYSERITRLLNKDVSAMDFSTRLSRIENANVTFVIPVRIDSPERSANLDIILEQLSRRKQTYILILEADAMPIYEVKKEYSNVRYSFVEDCDPVFHRTKYLNQLLRDAETILVGIWDTDVILSDEQIDNALQDISEGKACMSYPYDGRFYFCTLEESAFYRRDRSIDYLLKLKSPGNSCCMSNSVGGAFLVRKDIYLEAGGENEFFYGWGMEDQERVRRLFILGLPITRVDGPLFHLYHPRNKNSRYRDDEAENENRKEFLKVCGMASGELRRYIRGWGNGKV